MPHHAAAHRGKTPHSAAHGARPSRNLSRQSRGGALHAQAASHEDTSSERRTGLPLRRAYPPRSHDKTLSSPFNQPRLRRGRLIFSERCRFSLTPNVGVVRSGGGERIEPMTSCLQSRRSPN